MTISSPNLADLDRDGVADIVYGTGKDRLLPRDGRYVFSGIPSIPGHVVAGPGATDEILWQVPNPGGACTTARVLTIDGDDVPDVILGGRRRASSAYRREDGPVRWRV